MIDLQIRRARAEDVPAMLDVQRAAIVGLVAAPYDFAQISALQQHNAENLNAMVNDDRFIVTTEQCRIIGCAAWHPTARACRPPRITVEVRSVYVHPEYARQGVARAMLGHIEHLAEKAGATELALLATFNAVPFYRRQGFADQRAAVMQIGDVSLPGTAMAKTLVAKRSAA